MKQTERKVFLCGGLTGGPIIPLLAVSKNIPYQPIIIGVNNSFEKKLSQKRGYKFLQLPMTKLSLLTFSQRNISNLVVGFFDGLINFFKLLWSLILSIIYVFLNKPSLVLSAGGFTSVPIILVANFLKIIGVINCKIVIHQQDPKVGLSNRITAKYADLLSCTFEYTKNNYSQFSDSLIIPNPLDISKFANKKFENNNLENFLKSSTKPVLFVFGGGSGAMKINSWVNKNLKQITKNFSVVHLTGVLQKKSDPINNLNDYFSLISLDEDMGIMMKKADIVLCRAGLGSISELLYLNKKAFLVPINKSHQEQNANQVKESFYILDESEMSNWLSYILRQYNNGFHDKKFPSSASIERDLQAYYKKVNELDKKKQ